MNTIHFILLTGGVLLFMNYNTPNSVINNKKPNLPVEMPVLKKPPVISPNEYLTNQGSITTRIIHGNHFMNSNRFGWVDMDLMNRLSSNNSNNSLIGSHQKGVL
jgi:hypothetical protein